MTALSLKGGVVSRSIGNCRSAFTVVVAYITGRTVVTAFWQNFDSNDYMSVNNKVRLSAE